MQIGSLIRRAARQFGSAPCLTEGSTTLSFADFDAATDRVGNALLDRGLQKGDHVSVILPNSIECLIVYYALAKAGLVRVQLNVRETLANHVYKVQDSASRAVIHDDLDGLNAEILIGRAELAGMVSSGRSGSCSVDRELDEALRFGYTGGTTGKSKAVILTTRGELTELSAFLTDLVPEINEGDVFLHAAPIAHASGAFFLPALVRGAHAVVMPKFDAEEFLKLAEHSKASATFLVPTMIAMLLEARNIDTAKLSFRRIAYGAASISPALMKRAETRFGRIFAQCYGQAESPMCITFLKPEHHDREASCGRPFSVVEVAIWDENDRPLPPGERGEIVCRGPQTMAGYWNRPEQTAEAFRNGWLHTGDVGVMDEDGFFYIVDRKKEMISVSGFKVFPKEVEEVLFTHPAVREACVVGQPHPYRGEMVKAFVVAKSEVSSETLIAYCAERLTKFKVPTAIEFLPELPKSSVGKVLRRQLREKERIQS